MRTISYIVSLLLVGVAFFLLSEYLDSERMGVIAGGITAIGFMLNLTSYFSLNAQKEVGK
ncbi:hypothetical protein [Flavobacterium polysaccharolyticum]|uniref:Uncharacterized protein n=1 Tax=Flavobacterium polysaccharolyticum TaxID=3133148 RepID=A0ABU9NST8_9FLAO